jgi:tRNA threonylcarbamoyladenosine biosynthesis protein TsaB
VARDDVVVAEVSVRGTQAHGGVLPGLVQEALVRAGIGWPEVTGLAVSIGPGSFTGLRIGLALAKGIAFAGRLPLAAVSTLEALAWAAEAAPEEVVWAVLDARMGEVYAASFVRTPTGLVRRTADEALGPEALAARIEPAAVVVGDAPRVHPVLAGPPPRVRPFETHHPRGGIVARLGAASLRAGGGADVGTLEPIYVRASQAERTRGRADPASDRSR